MLLPDCNKYITNRAWLRACVGGNNLILRGVSALEYLELFVGYMNENSIDVYATEKGKYTNVNYHIVNDFNSIDYLSSNTVLCTSVNQTINDMLSEFDKTDELALTEALSNYYYSHNETFEGLNIQPKNMKVFNSLLSNAINYYAGG